MNADLQCHVATGERSIVVRHDEQVVKCKLLLVAEVYQSSAMSQKDSTLDANGFIVAIGS